MKEQEMRELDVWIAEHVMGLKCRIASALGESYCVVVKRNSMVHEERFNPTTDPGASMLVLEKCALTLESQQSSVNIYHCDGKFSLVGRGSNHAGCCESRDEALPLAICLFAKQLFS